MDWKDKSTLFQQAAKHEIKIFGILPPNYYSEVTFYENEGWVTFQSKVDIANQKFQNVESLENSIKVCLKTLGLEYMEADVLKHLWNQIRKNIPIFKGKAKEIVEMWCGTKGSSYFYVVEDHTLRHISNYSLETFSSQELSGKRKEYWKYLIPMEVFEKKMIIHFAFSNAGNLFIKELKEGKEKFITAKEYWKKYTFEIAQPFFHVIEEFKVRYIPMIESLWSFAREKNFETYFFGRAKRIEEALRDPREFFVSCMSMPSNKSRIRSIGGVTKWIHQLWVLKLVCEALEIRKFKKFYPTQDKAYWRVEQGKPYPIFIMDTPYGSFTAWYEAQMQETAHLKSLVTGKREWVRADIVVCKGEYERLTDVARIDLLIECKEKEFVFWQDDIRKQMSFYATNFNPKTCMVVSSFEIPPHIKNLLTSAGIVVCDRIEKVPSAKAKFKEEVKKCLTL